MSCLLGSLFSYIKYLMYNTLKKSCPHENYSIPNYFPIEIFQENDVCVVELI